MPAAAELHQVALKPAEALPADVGPLRFSPDGKLLATVTTRTPIRFIDTKSGKVVRLTQSPGANHDPSFSPDGRWVTFTQGGSIYVANEDGNNNVEIAKGASTPDWGPRAD